TAPLISAAAAPAFTTVVSGFSRYSNDTRALPAQEQQKIESLARAIVLSLARSPRPIHRIRLHGHADTDTPRRPLFERRMSLERARPTRPPLESSLDVCSAG